MIKRKNALGADRRGSRVPSRRWYGVAVLALGLWGAVAHADTAGANGGLTGTLVSVVPQHRNRLVSVDLSTGRIATLPGTESTIRANDLQSSSVRFRLRPDHSNPRGMLATVGQCRSSVSYELVCVMSLDEKGAIVKDSSFAFYSVADAGATGAAKRSWDGRFIILKDDESNAVGGGVDAVLALYDIEGRRVSRLNIGEYLGTEEPYDWLPSGEILVAHSNDTSPATLMRTKPYTTVPARRITLPVDGRIERIVVSPSGAKAVLRLSGSTVPFGLLVLDLKTNDVVAPVLRPKGVEGAAITSEAWSPDGRWLYLNLYAKGQAAGAIAGDTVRTRSNTQYAVRIDGGRYPLVQYPAVSTSSVRVLTSERENDRGGRVHVGNVPTETRVWRK